MKATISLIIIKCIFMISVGLAINPVSAFGKSLYNTKTLLLSFTTTERNKLALLSPQWELESDFTNRILKFPIVLNIMRLGSHLLQQNAEGRLLWDRLINRPKDTPFKLIAAPEIVTSEGQQAMIRQTSPIEYFVEESDGFYSLKTTPANESPGISVEVTVRSQGDDQVEVNYNILATVMNDRQKLLSTVLDVGKPIFKQSNQAGKYKFQLGKWYILSLFSTGKDTSGNEEYLAILMIIHRR
jgi:hypothetical protein